jgi:hypothetical protein
MSKAKTILGTEAKKLTKEELQQIINIAYNFADLAIEKAEKEYLKDDKN